MPLVRQKAGSRSTTYTLKTPFSNINALDAVVRKLVFSNQLACTSYRYRRRAHPPIEKVREMYTAKFTYTGPKGTLVGRSSEVYDSIEGYETGIAAVIANIANREAHRGKVKHTPSADHFSVMLKCHDPSAEIYYLNIARDRITLSSYYDDAIAKKVEAWISGISGLR